MRRLAPALLVLLAGCTSTPAAAPNPSVLMQADRAFAADVAGGGADAWAAWFAEDGAMIQEGAGEIRGRDAIRSAVAYLDQPGPSLTWAPTRADIAASGDLGWTTGTWEVRSSPDAAPSGRGLYVSIWRKQPDGSWKVVMDLGNPLDTD
jgi:ketosteroid isomerase-like protein